MEGYSYSVALHQLISDQRRFERKQKKKKPVKVKERGKNTEVGSLDDRYNRASMPRPMNALRSCDFVICRSPCARHHRRLRCPSSSHLLSFFSTTLLHFLQVTMASKEATVYVVDLGRSMKQKQNGRTKTNFDWAMEYVWDKITTTVRHLSCFEMQLLI
jgi:hypothetical protein